MRPFQWVKTSSCSFPMFFAQEIGDTDRLWNVAQSCLPVSACSPVVYIFSTTMDAARPLASGQGNSVRSLSRKVSRWPPLSSCSAICEQVHYVSASCIQATTRSSLLSGGYILPELSLYAFLPQTGTDHRCHDCRLRFHHRLEAGAAAGEIELSHWLIIMTFISLFLAFAKRRDDCSISWRPDRFHVRILPGNYDRTT